MRCEHVQTETFESRALESEVSPQCMTTSLAGHTQGYFSEDSKKHLPDIMMMFYLMSSLQNLSPAKLIPPPALICLRRQLLNLFILKKVI